MKRRQGCLVADLKKAKYVCLFFFFLLHVKTSFRSPMTIYNDDVSFFSSNSSCRANLHRHTLHCTSKAIGKDSIANSNLLLRLASLLLLVIRLPLSSTNQTKPTSTCRSVIFFSLFTLSLMHNGNGAPPYHHFTFSNALLRAQITRKPSTPSTHAKQ